jgi:type I restriction enzyme S subunit
MSKYRAYPEYKDSGVEWLGEVPGHWDNRRIGFLFNRKKDTGHPDAELLSVYRDYGVIPKSSRDDNWNKPSDDLTPYQLVKAGDLVMNKMKTRQGSIAVSEFEGIVSPAYHVAEPDRCFANMADSRYIHYLLRSPVYISQYERLSKGIRVNQWDLDYEVFKTIEALLPRVDEQGQIAAFLDRETAKIDRLIVKQEELIELLKEKRQAVISHAVTKGLDPGAPMKDSGVEWLGEIPAHWDRIRLKQVCSHIVDCLHSTPAYEEDGDFPAIRTADVIPGKLLFENARRVSEDTYKERVGRLEPIKGDIFYSREGERYGIAALVPSAVKACLAQRMMHFRVEGEFLPEFIMWSLNSESTYRQASQDVIGATSPHVNVETIRNFWLCDVPIKEQRLIVESIQNRVEKIDALIEKVGGMIEHLQERRTALISAAVTGKIDVRKEMAETLPSVETALAVEILNRCAGNCGRVKLQKLLFLVEHHGGVDVDSNYCRQAAGPMDGALLDRVESELEAFGYYRKCKHADGSYFYLKMENAGKGATQCVYPSTRMNKGLHIVNTLADKNTHECEAIATVYSAWNDQLIAGKDATRTAVIDEIMNRWHQNKRQTPRSEWLQWYDWVKVNMRPVGYGKAIKQECSQKSLLD